MPLSTAVTKRRRYEISGDLPTNTAHRARRARESVDIEAVRDRLDPHGVGPSRGNLRIGTTPAQQIPQRGLLRGKQAGSHHSVRGQARAVARPAEGVGGLSVTNVVLKFRV